MAPVRFGTGKTPSKSGKTAAQLDAEIDDALAIAKLDVQYKKFEVSRGRRLATLIAAFKKSPGIIITEKHGRKDLVIRSGEMQNRGEGKLRATMFGTDGPRGHITKNTDRELAEELLHYYVATNVRPASDAEVMRWTSSPEFTRGSKAVAFTQAVNTLSYQAGRQDKRDQAREIEQRAHALIAKNQDWDGAIKVLEAGIKEIG